MPKGPGKGGSGNPNGRPKGSTNKATADIRERIRAFVESNFDNLVSDIQSIPDVEKRCKVTLELFKYVMPALQSTSITGEDGKSLPAFRIEIVKGESATGGTDH
jgi:hypothetical protein